MKWKKAAGSMIHAKSIPYHRKYVSRASLAAVSKLSEPHEESPCERMFSPETLRGKTLIYPPFLYSTHILLTYLQTLLMHHVPLANHTQ